MTSNKVPAPGAILEAKKNPGGWVYEIAPGYDPEGGAPKEAILGAWRVNPHGEIEGDFQANPNFDANSAEELRPLYTRPPPI